MSTVEPMSPAEVLALPVIVDVPTAGRAFGLGRNLAYQLARSGDLCGAPVLQVGTRLRVRRADLLAALRVVDQQPPERAAA